MEVEQIVLVLQSCLRESELRNFLAGEDVGDEPYRRAAELILDGEVPGEAISSRLDADSLAHRERIRQLSLADLRRSLVVEFLEPGRNLGLIVWALLRDGRVGASHLASQIYKPFRESIRPSSETETTTSVVGSQVDLGESEEHEELDLDGLDDLEDITDLTGEIPGEEMTTDIDLDFAEEGLETMVGPKDDLEVEPKNLETSEDVLEGLEDVLEELGDEAEPSLADVMDSEELPFEEELGEDEASVEIPDVEELTGILEEDLPSVSTEALEELGVSDEEEVFEPGAELPPVVEEVTTAEEEPVSEVEEQPPAEVQYVTLAGIDIPFESLQRACCSVFGEPVELVTDPDLLSHDKIAVVGKQCGVKILHGPSWSIEPRIPPETPTDEPVTLSPLSAEEAFSNVFGEPIKVVPDPNLLGRGVIPIVGRQTGIVILRNKAARLDLPTWVGEDFAERIAAAERASSEKGVLEELGSLRGLGDSLNNGVKKLEDRVAALEATVDSLEYVPVEEAGEEPQPVVEVEEPAAETEALPEAEEEPTAKEEELGIEEDMGIDLEALGEIDELDVDETEEGEISDILDTSLEELDLEETIEPEAAEEEAEESLDLDFIDEIDKAAEAEEEEVKKIFSDETILILGGEDSYREEYGSVVEQLGGTCEWYQTLAEMSQTEIADLVDRSDLILTLSDAITDPGILQATNYAQENNKRCFAHHSANPASVRRQLVKLVNEGKV